MKDKRGVSPVLATLLLVVITVAIAVIVYAWTTMFTTMQTGRSGLLVIEEVIMPKPKENRTHVYDDRFNYTMAVSVRNIGSVDLIITDVYLNGTKVIQNTTSPCWYTLWYHVTGRDNIAEKRWLTPDTQWWMPDTLIPPGYSVKIYIVDAWLRRGHPCTIRVATAQGVYSDISFYPR